MSSETRKQAGKKGYAQLKTWSNVKAACEHWSENLRERLIEEGVRKKA